jgi:hypothetical protein
LIFSETILREKLDYTDPVKRGFVNLPEHWRCSSASYYAGQTQGCWRLIYGETRRWSVWGCIPTPERGNDKNYRLQINAGKSNA